MDTSHENKKELVYIGTYYDEEFYINLSDGDLTGWSFMGLRPETEDVLRKHARDVEPRDLGCEIPDFIERYFNWDAWYDDMEEDWCERHDVQAENERNGETYYLGFGTGTDIFNFFSSHEITDYDKFCEVFDGGVNIDKDQFKELQNIMAVHEDDEAKAYQIFLEWQKSISEYPNEATT